MRTKNRQPVEIVDTVIQGRENKWLFSLSWGPSGGKYMAYKGGALRMGLGKLAITVIIGIELDEFIIGYTKYKAATAFARKLFPEMPDQQTVGVPYPIAKDK